MDNPVILAI